MKTQRWIRVRLAAALLPSLGCANWAAAQPAPAASASAVHGAAIEASPSAPAAAATNKVVIHITDGVISADFETLASYTFNVPDMTAPNHPSVAQAEKQIPEIIKNLDGKTARIRGFMMPVKEAQGKTTEFLITRSQPSCCFSGAAEITEFVTVKVAGKGFDTMLDDPITIQGTLHVSAILDSGYIVGLYELDADKVVAPGS